MRTDYIAADQLRHILAALMPVNRLVLEVCLTTGIRLSDSLNLRTKDLKQRITIRELKTGKNRRIRLSNDLLDALTAQAGKIYVFEGRLDPRKHRTRQAVWADIHRAAMLFRLPKKLVIAPHTCRKVYAVGQYKRTCDIKAVQRLLNHTDEAVTWLYAAADELTERKLRTSR